MMRTVGGVKLALTRYTGCQSSSKHSTQESFDKSLPIINIKRCHFFRIEADSSHGIQLHEASVNERSVDLSSH